MKIKPIFRWYDIWIGLFIDTKKKHIYFFPIPCLGFKIELGKHCKVCDLNRTYKKGKHLCMFCDQKVV